jgi:hypothetical protein
MQRERVPSAPAFVIILLDLKQNSQYIPNFAK